MNFIYYALVVLDFCRYFLCSDCLLCLNGFMLDLLVFIVVGGCLSLADFRGCLWSSADVNSLGHIGRVDWMLVVLLDVLF